MHNLLLRLVVVVVLVLSSACSQENPEERVLIDAYKYVKSEIDIFNHKTLIEREKSKKSCYNMLRAGDKLVKKGNVGLAHVRYQSAYLYMPVSIAFVKYGESVFANLDPNQLNQTTNGWGEKIISETYGAAWIMTKYYHDTSLPLDIARQLENKIQCFSTYFELHGAEQDSLLTENFFQCVDMKPTLNDLVK